MAGTILGLSNYYTPFVSPVKSYEVNPSTNLMYGAAANKIYSQTFAKKIQSNLSTYLTSLNRNVNDLKLSSKTLASAGSDSSFNKKAVNASDTSSVTGTATSNSNIKAYTLNVSKLASSQVNDGAKLRSNDKTFFNAGVNTFKIESGENSKYISFTVKENDTNKTSLESMAKAINTTKSGVTAMVVSDSNTGTSFLKLSSQNTGVGSSFSITDISGSAASISSANSVTKSAQNAEYSIDGNKFTSQKNTIGLDNGKVELTLQKAENKDIKLTIAPDRESIKSDIVDFTKSYNNIISFTNSFSSDFDGAKKLGGELGDITNSRKIPLERIGISINSDKTVSVDEKKLDKALSDNLQGVSQLFNGTDGIAHSFYNKSIKVLNSPIDYSRPDNLSSFKDFYDHMQSVNKLNFSFNRNQYLGMVIDAQL